MVNIYGINNCDTVKKALKWLTENKIEYEFYDFKKQPITEALLNEFVALSDWSLLLNKRSTTFRNLPEDIKNNLTDSIMFKAALDHATLLKRPLLNVNNQLHLGFKPEQYHTIFNC